MFQQISFLLVLATATPVISFAAISSDQSMNIIPESVDIEPDLHVYVIDRNDFDIDIKSLNDEEIFGEEGLIEEVMEYEAMVGKSNAKRKGPKALRRTCAAQDGRASWYGGNFHGRRTANGEIYNQNELTAAHKTIPFHSLVRVTHQGRSVTVRINDAGPYTGGRVIDLSRAAAEAIGMISRGVGSVQLEILRCGR